MGATDLGTGATLGDTGEDGALAGGGGAGGPAATAGAGAADWARGATVGFWAAAVLTGGAAGLAAAGGATGVAVLAAGLVATLPALVPRSVLGGAGLGAGAAAGFLAAGSALAATAGFAAALAFSGAAFAVVLAGALARRGLATCLAFAVGFVGFRASLPADFAGVDLVGSLARAGDFITALISCCRGDAAAGARRRASPPSLAPGTSLRRRAGSVSARASLSAAQDATGSAISLKR